MNAQPRPGWLDMPLAVRARITEQLGARVTAWTNRDSGMMAGYAIQVQTVDGHLFIKAASGEDPLTQQMYRREAMVAQVLPEGAPAPEFRWVVDEDFGPYGPWVIIGYGMRPVRMASEPWGLEDIAGAVRVARIAADLESPGGPHLPPVSTLMPLDAWVDLADRMPAGLSEYTTWLTGRMDYLAELALGAPEAMQGTRLVHGTLRRPTVLLPAFPGTEGMGVDWIRAGTGAPFVDLVTLLRFVHAEGGPSPDLLLTIHPLPPGTDDDAVNAYLSALAGYLVRDSLEPAPPTIPFLRSMQREQAHVVIEWLRRRLGH
ncbi:phosphotransferase [Antribacter gilvus]|uniref:phosphotransferase n=1 Tax=Antribacter gilvus TaxID=2304675 RepID=UPI000F78CE3C|nr:phosphotransferase [Antribacter gilvus]